MSDIETNKVSAKPLDTLIHELDLAAGYITDAANVAKNADISMSMHYQLKGILMSLDGMIAAANRMNNKKDFTR